MKFTHFEALLLFAAVISAAFALLSKPTKKERVRYAVWSFLAFVLIAVAIGWMMYPFPR
jgi:multidrug transporter EmrE-like cation transporter